MNGTVKSKKAPAVPVAMPANERSMFNPAKPRRMFEEIINQIKAQIEDGRLQRGDKLPTERMLASQFQVSRNTVREALRTLEISGLVTLKRGSSGGAFVAAGDPQILNSRLNSALRFTDFSVGDLTHAMRAITVMLLDAALPTLTEADLKAMEANVRKAEAFIDDPKKRSAILIQFYRLLAEASENKILVTIADSFIELLQEWVVRLGSLSGNRVVRSRRALIKHLRAGDPDAARRELEAYLKELHELWLRGERMDPPQPSKSRRKRRAHSSLRAVV
jgi:GntR family transcriptional regulator, transcriptional repressor for pyruvate dehydrogenase complex